MDNREKWKRYMGDRLVQIKQTASRLVSDKPESQHPDDTYVEIDQELYKQLVKKAGRDKTTVETLVHGAIRQLLSSSEEGAGDSFISPERKLINPLLALDSLTTLPDHTLANWESAIKGGYDS